MFAHGAHRTLRPDSQADYDDASKEILRIRNGGHQDTAGLIEGELNFLRGRHEEARDDFAALKDSQDPQFRSYSYSILARLFAEQGHYASALQFLEQGIAKDWSQETQAVGRIRYWTARTSNSSRDNTKLACKTQSWRSNWTIAFKGH
jgi:predicted negative regulator of RcsB-dependent stress response